MVLFKRKPVQYLASPNIDNDETEVWEIKQTGEIFVDYESYLSRIEFYKQRRFICQVTGRSGLTFFAALKSELAGAQEADEAFPEALKGPILRRVQFQTIPRIDSLVDLIYEEFRADYYPGEAVTVHVVTGERLMGIVRDKSSFGAKILPDGTINPPFSRYFVSLDNRPEDEAVVDDAHISRDRKVFTKQALRSFIKKTVTRESWTESPWLVKPEIAKQYHIDPRVPPNLRQENKPTERSKKSQPIGASDYDGMVGMFQGNARPDSRHSEQKRILEVHKNKQQQDQQSVRVQQHPLPFHPVPGVYSSSHQIHQSPYSSHTFQAAGLPTQVIPPSADFHNSTFTLRPIPLINQPPPSLPPLVKHSIEDLQVPPRLKGPSRPALKFLSGDTSSNSRGITAEKSEILMKSVGLLLESWDTLNVYCEVFLLDSFTFDDFVEAMRFSSPDVECQLFVEIHCAALKMLVQSESDGGKVLVPLPEMESEGDPDDDPAEPSTTPEPDPRPKRRTTRSSLAKAGLTAELQKTHRAAEMQSETNWIDRLRKREFKDGGWQITMIGLLYQLSKSPRYFNTCESLLKELAPLHMEPTPDIARQQYIKLNVNWRIQALQILCMLIVDTKAVRTYMEECSEQMTTFRKEKIQWQRDRKQYLEKLRMLNEERKIQLPVNMPPPLVSENKPLVKITSGEEDVHESVEDENLGTDEDPSQTRSLRRGEYRALQRKRKREAEQDKKIKAEEKAKLPKHTKQFAKLLKDIQRTQELVVKCENEIATLDNDLREADCPRTRVLGKDRFWNRYFWFERNGMPYGGLPDSSTAEAGYANGCIWIQGPDTMEREGFIDMKPEWQNEYNSKFGMTVPQRKIMEEGSTNVYNAYQWGYYDDPSDVDALISWLDVRGFNELKLHKELKLYRDRIVSNMEKRKKYLSQSDPCIKVMATRRKELPLDNRCLAWRNNMAIAEIGHLHSDHPRVRKPTKRAAITSLVEEAERSTKNDATKGKIKKPPARPGSK